MTDDLNVDPEDAGRRSALILLDLLAVAATEDELPEGWAAPFAAELAQLGAVSLVVDDEAPEKAALDLTPLIDGMVRIIEPLILLRAAELDQDRLSVISALRATVSPEKL